MSNGRRARKAGHPIRMSGNTLLCGIALCATGISRVQGQERADNGAPASNLPIQQVTLFTSGVAYTERVGTVEGDATIPLLFRTAQINDILKSLVLIDQGGQVQAATYAARDPVSHTLQAFAIDVTNNMTQEEILNRLRGVRIALEETGKPTITGQIIGAEKRQMLGADGKPITYSVLNLLTDIGLTSVRLDTDKTVRILDPRLNKEFRDALAQLATGLDNQRRQVTLHFSGKGKRLVRVGYVLEAPLWKMSYRLLIGEATPALIAMPPSEGNTTPPARPVKPAPEKAGKPGKPYIQGWALVENTSDDDWQNVRLSLVSGRPVSFIQDLYQPLYIPRPEIGPDIVASPFPQTHGENLLNGLNAPGNMMGDAPAVAPAPSGPVGMMGRGGMGGDRADALALRKQDAAKKESNGAVSRRALGAMDKSSSYALDVDASLEQREAQLKRSVNAQAEGAKAGELFIYKIAAPVSLPRQQSAMIPVIAQDIEAEKILLFNIAEGSRFPLNAVRLHNNTKMHLKGGPVTLFDDGVYAGDARMEDVPPGDSRIVSYALDLTVEGTQEEPQTTIFENTLSIKRGILTATQRERIETSYTLKSKAEKPRTVLIEHPFDADFKLIAPEKSTERTANLYRFALTIPPGKSETLKVVVERPISSEIALFEGDINLLTRYSTRKDISAKVRTTLLEILQRRKKAQDLRAQAEARITEMNNINVDQDRIRKNMAALDRESALYKRYVAQLDAQETQIEKLRKDADALRAQAATADGDLRSYLDNLPALD